MNELQKVPTNEKQHSRNNRYFIATHEIPLAKHLSNKTIQREQGCRLNVRTHTESEREYVSENPFHFGVGAS